MQKNHHDEQACYDNFFGQRFLFGHDILLSRSAHRVFSILANGAFPVKGSTDSYTAVLLIAQFLRIKRKDGLQALRIFLDLVAGAIRKGSAHPDNGLSNFGGGVLIGQPVIHPAAILAILYQAGLFKNGEVLGNGRWRQSKKLNDLTYAELATFQRQQYADPVLVRERFGYSHKSTHDYLL
jgi:hypothetical protein